MVIIVTDTKGMLERHEDDYVTILRTSFIHRALKYIIIKIISKYTVILQSLNIIVIIKYFKKTRAQQCYV